MGTAISQTRPRYHWKRRLSDCYLNDRRKNTYKWTMRVHSQTEHAGQCAENSLGLDVAGKKTAKTHMETEPHKIPKSIKRFCLPKTPTFSWKQGPQNYFRHTTLTNRCYFIIPLMVLRNWVKLHLLMYRLELKGAVGKFGSRYTGLCIRLLGLPQQSTTNQVA